MIQFPTRLHLDGLAAPVRVRRSARARRIALRVDAAAGEVVLVLPRRAPLATGEAFLRSQMGWLHGRLAALAAPVALADGATVPLRGEPHRIMGTGRPGGIAVRDGLIEVGGPMPRLHARLRAWLRAEALADLSAAVAGHTAALGRPARRLTLRDPKTRWGSCSTAGALSFSWRLILAPPSVLAYVAAHEAAHLVEPNHSPAFWRVVAQLAPDHAAARAWLRGHGTALHRYR